MLILQTLILLIFLLVVTYLSLSAKIWLPLLTIIFLVATFSSYWSGWFLIVFWVVFVFIALNIMIPALRIACLSRPTLIYLRKSLPPMRDSEREALAVGDVGFEAELFCGQPQWEKFFAHPFPGLSSEEQAFLDEEVETLCGMIDEWQIDQQGKIPEPAWQYIKDKGFLGLIIDKTYDGKGFSASAHSAIITKIASRSISLVFSIMVPNSVGPAELLTLYGSEKQKSYYLPRLAKGEDIPCFALTAPTAGSDATAIPDCGFICRQQYKGKQILGVRLDWDKRYITLAPIATLLGVAFNLYDPEHLLGNKETLGITLALIPTDHPGVEIGKRHQPMNLAFMNGPTRGKNVFIPLDWIIGGQAQAGKGWPMLVAALSRGRAVSLLALSNGTGKLCYRMSGAYAYLREQFHQPIACFEGVEAPLARIAGFTYILEAIRLMMASMITHGSCPGVASAIVKYHSTEMARICINDAMDIHGGRAIQFGPRNYLGFIYQAIPISITVEGANILTRCLIIFGQGLLRCHPYLQNEIELAEKDDSAALKKFDKLLLAHIAYLMRNSARCLVDGLSGAWFIKAPKIGLASKYVRQLTRMSRAFAMVSDIAAIILGGNLKRRENLSARLGDVFSQLFLSAAVLKYFQANEKTEDESLYLHWAMQTCFYQMQQAFSAFLANFPSRFIAGFLRFMVFPWGRRYRQPSDELSHHLVQTMLKPSSLRDRISQHCYLGNDSNDAVGRLEDALRKNILAEPIRQKLHKAVKTKKISLNGHDELQVQIEQAVQLNVLSAEEGEILHTAEQARSDVIQVDEFFDQDRQGGI
ncbi:MAG: acyl-CoA dehydrogenase [Gammaproteobacteria bacterium]